MDDTKHIDLQGISVPYERAGRGPPMVVFHGGGGPGSRLPFFASLTERYDVIAPTHPGFANTPIPSHFDDLEDLVYLYLDFFDALELTDVVLLGFSMGGWLAAELAVRNSHRLRRLILVDPVGIKPGPPDQRDVADIFAVSESDLAALMYHDPSNAPRFSELSDGQLTEIAANRVALAMYTWSPYMHNPKLAGRLHRITIPTLLLWGESDGLVSPEYGAAYQALIPNSQLVVIKEAGHLPQVEQPAQFLSHVNAFAAPENDK